MASQEVKYLISMQDKMSARLDKIDKKTSSLGSSIKKLGIGIGVAFAGKVVLGAMSKMLTAWDKQEQAIAQVKQGLQTTGGAVGKTLEELTSMASKFQSESLFGDEDILQSVTAQLLTFTNITGEQFDKTAQAALDVTTRINGADASAESLRATSIALGKAINAPTANLGALGRMGIQFSKKQKAVIKSLEEGGDLAAAQGIILTELEKQYGGAAKAAAKAGLGGFKKFKNIVGDIGEGLGGMMAKGLIPLIPLASKAAKALQKMTEVPLTQKLKEENRELNFLVHSLIGANDNERRRSELITELNTKYPEFLTNINLEKVSNQELLTALKQSNAEYRKKFKIQAFKENIAKIDEELAELFRKENKLGESITTTFENTLKATSDLTQEQEDRLNLLSDEGKLIWLNNKARRVGNKEDSFATRKQGQLTELKAKQNKLFEKERKIQAQIDRINPVEDEDEDEDDTNTTTTPGGKTTPGKTTPGKTTPGKTTSDITRISAAAPKTFIINLGSLVETFTISTQNLKESSTEVKQAITNAFLDALNETQVISGN